jgi:hypothetical protein
MSTRPAPTLNEYLDLILEAAQAHGEEDIAEHEVGDLQAVIHEMWKLMTDAQKAHLITRDTVRALLEDWHPDFADQSEWRR